MTNQLLPPVIVSPSALEISAISLASPMVITVSANSDQVNTYIVGQLLRLNVPITYGMFQANGLFGTVLSNDGTNITVNIDSTQFDPFVVPAVSAVQPASISPAGSRNLQISNYTSALPFQSYNNIGN